MRVIGIDPGIAITGIGILEEEVNGNQVCVDYLAIQTPPGIDDPTRLQQIFVEVQEIVQRYKPEEAAIEKLFFQKNVKTAMQVGQARGVILLALNIAKVSVTEYTPMEVKQAITGYGKANKQQIQVMVQAMLQLTELPKPDDAADALAIAICHINSRKMNSFTYS